MTPGELPAPDLGPIMGKKRHRPANSTPGDRPASEPAPTAPDPAERAAFLERLASLGMEPTTAPAESLIHRALIHRSHASEKGLDVDNERLEFLGDSVVSLAVSERLYQGEKRADEGRLSKRRSAIVSRENLGEVGRRVGLGELMLLGVGEERTGGRWRESVVGSCLEAVIGAIYLEKGLEAARAFTDRFVMASEIADPRAGLAWDSKSLLQEATQRAWKIAPSYRLVESTGPDHDRRFLVEVSVLDKPLATGEGKRLKEAENAAAEQALRRLKEPRPLGDETPAVPSGPAPKSSEEKPQE